LDERLLPADQVREMGRIERPAQQSDARHQRARA
jgi:hypothetical protein